MRTGSARASPAATAPIRGIKTAKILNCRRNARRLVLECKPEVKGMGMSRFPCLAHKWSSFIPWFVQFCGREQSAALEGALLRVLLVAPFPGELG